jgi:threonine/homoserine/homoserine lactone efflux protein
MAAGINSILVNGFVLGWSVAWPPGPINAEMIRRGLLPVNAGGGFWRTWQIGLGACSGDFLWALFVTLGAGALVHNAVLRLGLGIFSLALLLYLVVRYAYGAWRDAMAQRKSQQTNVPAAANNNRLRSGGYLLGLILALSSPFNIGFWFAVIGSQQSGTAHHSFASSLALACSVVLGAVTWTVVLCTAVRQGARIFARPAWQIATQALTAAVMLFFAVRLVRQLL